MFIASAILKKGAMLRTPEFCSSDCEHWALFSFESSSTPEVHLVPRLFPSGWKTSIMVSVQWHGLMGFL